MESMVQLRFVVPLVSTDGTVSASTALRGFLSNTSPTKVRHLRVCSVRVEVQPGAARFFVVSIALRMRLRSLSLALALPQQ